MNWMVRVDFGYWLTCSCQLLTSNFHITFDWRNIVTKKLTTLLFSMCLCGGQLAPPCTSTYPTHKPLKRSIINAYTILRSRSHQTFHPILAVKLLKIYIEKHMLGQPLYTLFQPPEMPTDGAKNGGCDRSMSLRIWHWFWLIVQWDAQGRWDSYFYKTPAVTGFHSHSISSNY